MSSRKPVVIVGSSFAGLTAALELRKADRGPPPAGVPTTGQTTESMANVAAHNIAADLESSSRDSLPLEDLAAMCILDAGNNGALVL